MERDNNIALCLAMLLKLSPIFISIENVDVATAAHALPKIDGLSLEIKTMQKKTKASVLTSA